jgi:glycosyltransferase involved in cell wall biosynthesis
MRIVVAIPFSPWPVQRGIDRLIMNLLAGLSAHHDVALATMALGREDLARLREIEGPRIRIEAMLAPHRRGFGQRAWRKARNLALGLITGVPAQVNYAAPRSYLELIADTARTFEADIVLASYWHLYRLPDYVDTGKLVLVTYDLDFLVNPGRVGLRPRGMPRAIAALRARSLERIERMAYDRYETILTVTEADAEILSRDPSLKGKRIASLPLALDLSEFDPTAYRRENDRVLFLGSFHADFNIDAYRFFVTEVAPRLLELHPTARIEIVGEGLGERMKRLAPSPVSFSGYVESIAPHIGRCSVMVLPMRFCGGVRIRMLEAAAMGTPVVSTPVGVAGMGLTAGTEYVEAESAEGMAGAIAGLLRDADEAARIGDAARRWACEHISMESYPARLDALVEKLVHQP